MKDFDIYNSSKELRAFLQYQLPSCEYLMRWGLRIFYPFASSTNDKHLDYKRENHNRLNGVSALNNQLRLGSGITLYLQADFHQSTAKAYTFFINKLQYFESFNFRYHPCLHHYSANIQCV